MGTHSVTAESVVVFDFETTGLSPRTGDRPIEIGAVRIEKGVVIDRFQRLMNPGFRISGFIEDYTGISNAMLREAAPCETVMEAFATFLGDDNLVAHNASFDRRFLEAEFDRIAHRYKGEYACSMLIARRIYQHAPNHRLASLVSYCDLLAEDVFHRALADSEMTARLWMKMIGDIRDQYLLPPLPFSLMQSLSRQPKKKVHQFLADMGKIAFCQAELWRLSYFFYI